LVYYGKTIIICLFDEDGAALLGSALATAFGFGVAAEEVYQRHAQEEDASHG